MNPTTWFMEATYLIASILFVLALKGMSHPDTARRGMFLAEAGMFAAIVGTLIGTHIVTWTWIIAGLALGSILGAWMAIWVPMTAMPQRTALSHAFGALAAALVGIGEFVVRGTQMGGVTRGALGFEVMLGALTTTGSLIAAGKLQGIIQGKPVQFRGQNLVNLGPLPRHDRLLCPRSGFTLPPTSRSTPCSAPAFVFGILLVIPIGSADMPVVMSLLNSYAGLASAATGFVLGNNVLIIAGTLDGFSGLILSILMCKAMNRSITNVLFGGIRQPSSLKPPPPPAASCAKSPSTTQPCSSPSPQRVVFVPGYGLATAQAQHAVRELAELLESRGVDVKYAIHPVAGRMPGHMNVLLAEANVPYSAAVRVGADQSRISHPPTSPLSLAPTTSSIPTPATIPNPSSPACPFSKSTAPGASSSSSAARDAASPASTTRSSSRPARRCSTATPNLPSTT